MILGRIGAGGAPFGVAAASDLILFTEYLLVHSTMVHACLICDTVYCW
jgi:hypothetical protein